MFCFSVVSRPLGHAAVLQVVQLFDSWAHHLSPEQFAEFSLPYSNRIVEAVRAKYPHVPLIFHANGGEERALLLQHSGHQLHHVPRQVMAPLAAV
jgi:uroporphyrinogen-III decarboxylase